MKVGDMVKFSDEHSSRPGYDYCAAWIGLVLESSSERVNVLWYVPVEEVSYVTYYESHIDAYQALEVIGE
jgi:hypothetical protein